MAQDPSLDRSDGSLLARNGLRLGIDRNSHVRGVRKDEVPAWRYLDIRRRQLAQMHGLCWHPRTSTAIWCRCRSVDERDQRRVASVRARPFWRVFLWAGRMQSIGSVE